MATQSKEKDPAPAPASDVEVRLTEMGNKLLTLENKIAEMAPGTRREELEAIRKEYKDEMAALRAELKAEKAKPAGTTVVTDTPPKKKSWIEGW